MLGTARTEFGSISCRFAQGAHLKSLFGDVEIEESAMHAQIRAGHRVIVHGTVLGGVCYGESQVYVRVAGSPAGVNTVLMAGRNRAIYDQIEQLRHRAVRHAQKLRQYEGVRLDLSLEESGERMEPDDRKALWMTVLRKERIEQDLVRMSRKKAHLLGMINADRGSRISIEGAVYPKTRISIDEVSTDIEHLTQFATFSKDYEIGDLRMTPFS